MQKPYKTIKMAVLYGSVAQGLEQGTHNPLVVGSKPTGPTNNTLNNLIIYQVLVKTQKNRFFLIL